MKDKLTYLIVGVLIGTLIMLTIQFNTQLVPTKIYEDGSYYGCIEGELCDDGEIL